MITLDQVMLLEQKVESAVAKIQQLQAENDALRTKCQELTNALSSKTEQLSSIETDQNQIENGIKKALDRLLYIENAVLKTGASTGSVQAPSVSQATQPVSEQPVEPEPQKPVSYVQYNQPVQQAPKPAAAAPQLSTPAPEAQPVHTEPVQPVVQSAAPVQEPHFDSMQPLEEDDFVDEETEEESQDNLGFDIF